MRLIDADGVYKKIESCGMKFLHSDDWDDGYNCGLERAESEIECAPTVKAVPFNLIDRMIEDYQDAVAKAVYTGEFHRADNLSSALVALKLAKANALKEAEDFRERNRWKTQSQ